MSEQLIQNSELSAPIYLGDNRVYNIGATTLKDLKKLNIINTYSCSSTLLNKKPDGLVVQPNGDVLVYAEYKNIENFTTKKDIEKAINQELKPAQAIKAKIFLTKSAGVPVWINPQTGNRILNEHENALTAEFNPALKPKETLQILNRITSSINSSNDKLLSVEYLNPKELAKSVHQKLFVTKGISPSTALYTFVELFLFKYLSDLRILTGHNTFDYIYNLYDVDSDVEVLKSYLADNGPRERMRQMFPTSLEDETSIINGNIFHEEIGDADTFKKILKDFKQYEKDHGKFINISKDFKSQLFESFLKQDSDTKKMGQFFTPLKIVEEMVKMVDVTKGMSVCDPACGVGKFLLEAVSNKITDLYEPNNGHLEQNISLTGYDKYSEENGDKIIILAKANSVIYFSKFLTDNPSERFVNSFARNFLNSTFHLKKSSLGTLECIENNKYDLILANPPYIVNGSSEIKSLAKQVKVDTDGNADCYSWNGLGIESLFIEWIVKALKPNGIANVIVPDGLLANMANTNLKAKLKELCYIKSIISLPNKSFFNTPKKTYILTIQKKEMIDGEYPVQKDKVFAYICNSIGETLDVNRFDIDSNDLRDARIAWNLYRSNDEETRKNIPLLKDSNLNFKELDINSFDPEKQWTIENWWSKEEKIKLGIKKEQKVKTVQEFQDLIDETINLMNDFKEELECLK